MKTKNLLKKAFLLLALMGGASSAWADTTYKITYNGSDAGSTTYFGYSGNHNFNTKFTGCTYDGTNFTSGLKLESSSTITFTNTNTATKASSLTIPLLQTRQLLQLLLVHTFILLVMLQQVATLLYVTAESWEFSRLLL